VVDVDRPGDRCRDVGWWLRHPLCTAGLSRSTARMSLFRAVYFGEANALGIARILHFTTVLALGVAGLGSGAGVVYFAGVAVAGLLLLMSQEPSHCDAREIDDRLPLNRALQRPGRERS